MRSFLFAIGTATTLVAAVPAWAHMSLGAGPGGAGVQRDVPFVLAGNDNEPRGGADIGPLGQCFNPPDCGNKRAAYAAHCPLVRERIVTSSGNVIYKRHPVCS